MKRASLLGTSSNLHQFSNKLMAVCSEMSTAFETVERSSKVGSCLSHKWTRLEILCTNEHSRLLQKSIDGEDKLVFLILTPGQTLCRQNQQKKWMKNSGSSVYTIASTPILITFKILTQIYK